MDMDTPYRSKDVKFMRQLKKAVYKGMSEEDDEEKQLAWKHMERRVIMDDLHKYAIEQIDMDEPVQMGRGDLNAHLLVLTMKPLTQTKEGKILAETIIDSGKFKHVYYTAKYKTPTIYKNKVPIFNDLLDSEIKILKPKAIITFGEVLPIGKRVVEEYLGYPVIQTHLLSKILNNSDADDVKKLKNEVWQDVKEIRKHYKK